MTFLNDLIRKIRGKKKYKVGLVLSGGGAKGVMHLGVYKALIEMGVEVDIISGVSAGAIAGAFLAKEYNPLEVLRIIENGSFFDFKNILIRKKGFFDMSGIEKIIKKYFPENSFEIFKKPLYVTTTDILNNKIKYFNSGNNLCETLLASASLPPIYPPVKIDGDLLIDGGILNNFPVEPLRDICDVIIGVSLNYIEKEKKDFQFKSIKNITSKAFNLNYNSSTIIKKDLCDLFIEVPGIEKFGIFSVKKLDEIFKLGYEYTLTLKNEVENLKKKI